MKYKPKNNVKPKMLGSSAPYRRFASEVNMEMLESFLLEDPDLETFARALRDPEYSEHSFIAMCRRFSVSLSRLQALYTEGMRSLGLLRMSTELPQVMADVAEDAKSRDIPCPRCDGKLVVPASDGPAPCPLCKQIGHVRVPGDKHARDLVFESMKLTGITSPLVAISQDLRSSEDTLGDMFRRTQTITLGRKEEPVS